MTRVTAPVTRVSLVEDETFVRTLLHSTLSRAGSVRVAHSLSGVQEAALAIRPRSTDVAILDVNLLDGNGIALGVRLQRADPRLSIILLSALDVLSLFETVQADVPRPWSYLSKRSTFSSQVLLSTVAAAAAGQSVIDPELVQRSTPRAGTGLAELSAGQLRVLRLVAEGLSNSAIAERLNIQERSVEGHLAAIYRVLDLNDPASNRRVAAVLRFLRETGRDTP